MSMFTTGLNGKPINTSLVQTVFINPEDNTNIIWFFKNGEIYEEDLVTEEEATNRYNDILGLLLGTTVAELEQRIAEQQQTISDLNQEIEVMDDKTDELCDLADDILGVEEV